MPDDEAGPPVAASVGDDVFDPETVASLRVMMSDQPGGFRGLATDFVDAETTSLEVVRAALAAGDTDTARRKLHGIKGAAATIGAHQLADACRSVEERLEVATGHTAADDLSRVEHELERVAAWVRDQPQE